MWSTRGQDNQHPVLGETDLPLGMGEGAGRHRHQGPARGEDGVGQALEIAGRGRDRPFLGKHAPLILRYRQSLTRGYNICWMQAKLRGRCNRPGDRLYSGAPRM